ncbi:hypothetical protein SCP_1801630 [Sparassis crispa]|uniref:Uncharacterized protein n=1 Tax=Sparassis crispa TaxID=139825 RepID=A0A401H6Y0_9APHY|nr:hypothetical protein SCP_1801630 [Sparassis crispa]GBE90139.1 hypothetical protein SCP_1801630 [Sparassis crispa]
MRSTPRLHTCSARPAKSLLQEAGHYQLYIYWVYELNLSGRQGVCVAPNDFGYGVLQTGHGAQISIITGSAPVFRELGHIRGLSVSTGLHSQRLLWTLRERLVRAIVATEAHTPKITSELSTRCAVGVGLANNHSLNRRTLPVW